MTGPLSEDWALYVHAFFCALFTSIKTEAHYLYYYDQVITCTGVDDPPPPAQRDRYVT